MTGPVLEPAYDQTCERAQFRMDVPYVKQALASLGLSKNARGFPWRLTFRRLAG
jgi:hypothetical protein